MPAKRAVFSALLGNHETLRELDISLEPDIDYLMFTDDTKLESKTWQLILVDKAWPNDNARSQRALKILGHPKLSDYQATIYVDNNVVLKRPASELFDFALKDSDIAFPHHSLRNKLSEEFEAVTSRALDATSRVTEQREHYEQTWPELLDSKPLWCGLIIRNNTPQVQDFNRIWYEHILRYSRRDQLSVLIALKIAGLQYSQLEIEHEESNWHRRDHSLRRVNRVEARATEPDLETEIADLKKQIAKLKSSTSWRVTAPLRRLTKLFKQKQ